MPGKREIGIDVSIFINGDTVDIGNYRPILLLINVCERRDTVITNKLIPTVNTSTKDNQRAYKTARSTMDIIAHIRNRLIENKDGVYILAVPSKVVGKINSDGLWRSLYEMWMPINPIGEIQSGHTDNQLCGKHKGELSKLARIILA